MSTVTFQVPDELAARLRAEEARIPEILERGLLQLDHGESGYGEINEVLETLATLPTPEEVLALRASERLQARISQLLEKNRQEGLSATEETELDGYEYLEHVVRMAKERALQRLAGDGGRR